MLCILKYILFTYYNTMLYYIKSQNLNSFLVLLGSYLVTGSFKEH